MGASPTRIYVPTCKRHSTPPPRLHEHQPWDVMCGKRATRPLAFDVARVERTLLSAAFDVDFDFASARWMSLGRNRPVRARRSASKPALSKRSASKGAECPHHRG